MEFVEYLLLILIFFCLYLACAFFNFIGKCIGVFLGRKIEYYFIKNVILVYEQDDGSYIHYGEMTGYQADKFKGDLNESNNCDK